jgi:hypothetical protein
MHQDNTPIHIKLSPYREVSQQNQTPLLSLFELSECMWEERDINFLQCNLTGNSVIFDSKVGFNQRAYKHPDGSVVTLKPGKSSNDCVISVFQVAK